MEFKTILAPLGASHVEDDLDLAIGLCQSIEAHLSAVVIAIAAPPSIGGYAGTVSTAWLEERERDLAVLAERTETVKERLKSAGLSFDVQDLYTEAAWADQDIAQRALYADLTLVGCRAAQDQVFRKRILDGALFQSPAPLLFNPTNQLATLSPRSVLVAWDSRREAARAVHQALPVLISAADVHVTLVDPIALPGRSGEEPGADVAAYLARHRIRVAVDVLSSGGKSVDETLKRHAVDVGAELLIMGAYSHSRLRERIFGGVTQSMFETSRLPIFCAH